MEDAQTAIHILEPVSMVRDVCHTTVPTFRDWDQKVNALIAHHTPEPKVTEPSVDQISATSDKKSTKTEHANTAHSTKEYAKI